eukprot:SAG31_NODE_12884_length_909_cov_1.067901_1_plen_52_part_01
MEVRLVFDRTVRLVLDLPAGDSMQFVYMSNLEQTVWEWLLVQQIDCSLSLGI